MKDRKEQRILALDLSAGAGSLAILDGTGTVLSSRRWPQSHRGSPELWSSLSALWAEIEGGVSSFSLLATGRGPGRYTGLRTSLTLAQALALPARLPVHAVDSGRALARGLLVEGNRAPARVAVAGDARRGRYWIGFFRNREGWPERETPWELCAEEAPLLTLPSDTVGISAEWSRIAPAVGGTWIREDRMPDAVEIGRLALQDRAAGIESEPLSPIYLHPAVQPPENVA